MMQTPIIFETFFDEETQLHQQQTEFIIRSTPYTIIFACENSLTESFAAQIEDDTPLHYQSYSVKFTATQRIQEFNETGISDNLYKNPNQDFYSIQEIKQLHDILMTILLTHQQTFHVQCYYFVAETPSLQKMYHRLCSQSEKNLIKFRKVIKENCFILIFEHDTEAT